MSDEPKPRGTDNASTAEEVLRVQDVWDEIARSPADVPLAEAQREEAERRLLDHVRNPAECSAWEDIRRRLESKR